MNGDKWKGIGIKQWMIMAALMIVLGIAGAWAVGRMMPDRVLPKTVSEQEGPSLTEEEEMSIRCLYELLESKSFAVAAAWMEGHKEEFSSIYYEKLNRQNWLFDGNGWKTELDGEGLVLKKSNLAFFGTFEDGAPQGENLAFQVLNMDTPRYDYSMGQWSGGRMEGSGRSGYHYYQGAGEGVPVYGEKRGNFKNDLLDGSFKYTISKDEEGEVTWNLKAEEGVTVLDQHWQYDEGSQVYRLLAFDARNTGYILKAEEAESVRWKNLLEWN